MILNSNRTHTSVTLLFVIIIKCERNKFSNMKIFSKLSKSREWFFFCLGRIFQPVVHTLIDRCQRVHERAYSNQPNILHHFQFQCPMNDDDNDKRIKSITEFCMFYGRINKLIKSFVNKLIYTTVTFRFDKKKNGMNERSRDGCDYYMSAPTMNINVKINKISSPAKTT